MSRRRATNKKEIYGSYLSWTDGSFTVCHAYVSVGLRHAAVTFGAHPSLLPAIQTPHRYPPDGLPHPAIRHSPLRSDDEQLSVSRHLSWDIVSTTFHLPYANE